MNLQIDRDKLAKQLQRKLVLGDQPPLVLATVDAARQFLAGHDEDDILALIEEYGFIPFAWDIALGSGASREIRILPDHLAWYARTQGKGEYPGTYDTAVASLLKLNADKPFIKGSTLRLILNCSISHLTNLVSAKSLAVLPGTDYGRGPAGTPLITVDSLKQFLKSRRFP